MAAMNMSATEQIHIQLDQGLQDIGGTRHNIARFELLGWYGQKAVMGTEDAILAYRPFIKMLHRHLYLARRNIGFAIKANRGNTIGTIKKLGGGKMLEELALSTMIDIFQCANLVEHRD